MTTYAMNQEHRGVELYFDRKPEQNTLSALKVNGWRWNGLKKCWYNKQSDKTIEFAQTISEGKEPAAASKTEPKSNNSPAYHKKVSDYISLETYEKRLAIIMDKSSRAKHETETRKAEMIRYHMENFNTDCEYSNLTKNIRQAIVAKSIKMDPDFFEFKYQAIWAELPVIEGLKPGKKYSATWGYDQTNITTATHYGKAFGLDVLVTGGFGHGDVLLKRIDKNERFSESCMNFSPNTYTDKEIIETNTYASYFGH